MVITFVFALSSFLLCRSTKGVQFVCPQNSIRVALAVNLSSSEFSIIQGEYEIVDYVTKKVISSAATGTWIVAPKGSQNIQLSNNGNQVQGLVSSHLILRQKNIAQENLFKYKNKRYRGDLLIENLNGSIHIINVIDIEQYLYGVVGLEMGMGAVSEAYKAQAVVSRTYALYYKQHPQLNYDLGTSQKWQVYGGYEAELQGGEGLRQAVDATRGLAIYYDNNLIQAFFHSNSGGYTESGENVWYANLPYLRPISTPQDVHALQVAQSGEWPAITYQWEKSFTKQDLANRIQQWNTEHIEDRINVGTLIDISISNQAVNPVTREYLPQKTQSGRVTQLDIIGTSGMKSFFRDNIRSVLGLRSTLFQVCYDSMVQIWNVYNTVDNYNQTNDIMGITVDGLVSKLNGKNDKYYVICADGVKTLPKAFSTITFKGKGYGHGLGMSQWGARGMAANGSDYRAIIEHFYNQDYYDGRLVVKSCI
jgi:stage II sporulation protein D